MAENVLGQELKICCTDPMTGFYRTGKCETGINDTGSHVVCARLTPEFLEFTRARGNDLSTPRPEYNFPGLKPGDRWCLCAARWYEAYLDGFAPPVDLHATHRAALKIIPLEVLREYSLDNFS